MADPLHSPDVRIDVSLPRDLIAPLRSALLRARAAELGEVRRRNVRLTAGYGDSTTRDVMDDEGDRARRRYEALDAVLDALERADADTN